jgi:hypothetical protein
MFFLPTPTHFRIASPLYRDACDTSVYRDALDTTDRGIEMFSPMYRDACDTSDRWAGFVIGPMYRQQDALDTPNRRMLSISKAFDTSDTDAFDTSVSTNPLTATISQSC